MKSIFRCITAAMAAVILVTTVGGYTVTVDASSFNHSAQRSREQVTNEDVMTADIQSVVLSAVDCQLQEAGFITGAGVAGTTEDESYEALGIYYYDENLEFFKESNTRAVGFIEVVREDSPFLEPSAEESLILVHPVDQSDDNNAQLVCTYQYDSIVPSHFIYADKYVTFYQQTGMRVVYTVQDNEMANYDLSLGSLYSFDDKRFIYDETIIGEYKNHSGTRIYENVDFKGLESSLRKLSEDQLKAGYEVLEYTVVYISPERVQEYLNSKEDDEFFGYSVNELTGTFGLGTALTYTGDGFQERKYLDPSGSDYNWKSFLQKVGASAGIIIVGAVIAPVTGGVSFGCALMTIAGYSGAAAISAGLGNLAIQTAKGMMEGKDIKDALLSSRDSSLDAFANTLLITSVVASVGVNVGLIKPVACFPAGTPVSVYDANKNTVYKNIEEIREGDVVLSYDESTGAILPQRVVSTSCRTSHEFVELVANEDTIVTTQEHPFYIIDKEGWKAAKDIEKVDKLTNVHLEEVPVYGTRKFSVSDDISVYNLEIENTHTYFVGKEQILVHNDCTRIASMRSKAVKDAWANEKEAVLNGTSKYNWTEAQQYELIQTGKIHGYEGHHIITVHELENTVNENLIADPDNIVFLTKQMHLKIHRNNFQNSTDYDQLVELLPWVQDRVTELLKLVA